VAEFSDLLYHLPDSGGRRTRDHCGERIGAQFARTHLAETPKVPATPRSSIDYRRLERADMLKHARAAAAPAGIDKCPTGIRGLDEITDGGLPRNRPTLVCGGAGCGKTLLGMEFLVRGVREFDEPGVFVSFEETPAELAANVASLGFDVNRLMRRKRLAIDHVVVERGEIEETGEYDLEGLFARIGAAIDEVGAVRIVLDGVEALFAGIPNEGIVRSELRRLFHWFKARQVTAVITAEQGANTLTRHGLEEYISDCVVVLDNRVVNQVTTRRLRVVKYRGSAHGSNEYPTMIDEKGLSILPISSVGLAYGVSRDRVPTGIGGLDEMLGGKGVFKGASVLVSGTAGTGKTSVAAAFADGVCRRRERCLYFSFEESPDQIVRNMRSIGLNLGAHVRSGLLQIHSSRSTLYGLEQHLVSLHKHVLDWGPSAVVLDPVTNLGAIGSRAEITAMLTRVIDFLKTRGITALFTSLIGGGEEIERSDVGISSLMDTWIQLKMVRSAGSHRRLLYILKSRGMAHAADLREFQLTNRGIVIAGAPPAPRRR
jgi:circadian clock protein KaiC